MTTTEAIAICREWFAHCEHMRKRSEEIERLARLARQGPDQHSEARQLLAQIDKHPTVYDGDRLLPAVRHLVAEVEAKQ